MLNLGVCCVTDDRPGASTTTQITSRLCPVVPVVRRVCGGDPAHHGQERSAPAGTATSSPTGVSAARSASKAATSSASDPATSGQPMLGA